MAVAAALGAASGVLLLGSCASVSRTVFVPPEIPGANYVGNKACLDCHAVYVRQFPSSPHARLHFSPETKVQSLESKVPGPDSNGPSQLKTRDSGHRADSFGCESCHGPASKHVAAGGGPAKFIANPGKDPTACFQCHLETHAEFSLPQHHQVSEGRMNCVQCHDPHGSDIFKASRAATAGGLAMARLNETCAVCHREQTRPFVFEHEALREGCTVCHNPHGSVNRMMLVQSDANLCLRCHAQNQQGTELFIGAIPHSAFLRQATCWAAGCHSSIHGSNVDPRMRY